MPRGPKTGAPKAKVEHFYQHVGNYVTRARLDADLTQQELAERVGLTRTSIANLEAGRQRISAYMLWRIADALQMSPAALCPPIARGHLGKKARIIAYPSQQRETQHA